VLHGVVKVEASSSIIYLSIPPGRDSPDPVTSGLDLGYRRWT
jgi:hypothetical protein